MSIGARICEARRARGVTQKTLATWLGVAQSAVAQWETDRTLPIVEKRIALSKLLGIPFADLLPAGSSLSRDLPIAPEEARWLALIRQMRPESREQLLQVAAMAAEGDNTIRQRQKTDEAIQAQP